MIFDKISVLNIAKEHSEKTEDWIKDARKKSKTLKALVTGEGFSKELIERISYLESKERAIAREKYAHDIRDVFARVMSKRQNVFDANGTSENIQIKNENIKSEFVDRISNFKSNKSLHRYLSESFFSLKDIDPNGGLMLEYKKENKNFELYPTYKSIDDIRYYEAEGQKVGYIVFEPKVHEEADLKTWRIVDEKTDWTINEIADRFFVNETKTFEHPFGNVPFLILSEKEKTGTNTRLSSIEPILELCKEYAIDKSVLSIYRKQKGFPVHYRFGTHCKPCAGTGTVENDTCTSCNGLGYPKRGDVTDMYILPFPKANQPSLPNKLMGFESPDLDFLEYMDENLRQRERIIDDTIWGTDKAQNSDKSNETATGIVIDHQPTTSKLNQFTDCVEYVDNTLANWVLNFVDLTKNKSEKLYFKSYGRRYILENPDVLNEKYQKAKAKGDNNTILDKLLEEFILSKYKSDPFMQSEMIKKSRIEPYVHLSIGEVKNYFGSEEASKKISFQEFWKDAETSKDEKDLKDEFQEYLKTDILTLKIKENESSKMRETVI